MVVVLSLKNVQLIKGNKMSRTFRKKIKSSKIIRDGERQYADSSCRNHGSCDYCKNNRTFEKAISLKDELKLMRLDEPLI